MVDAEDQYLRALRRVELKTVKASSVLTLEQFDKRRAGEFEQFIQLFMSAYRLNNALDTDIKALMKFTERLSSRKKTSKERFDLFSIARAFLKTWSPQLGFPDTILKLLIDQNGCLEFDPQRYDSIGLRPREKSTTLVGFDPKFRSSYYLPPLLTEGETKSVFNDRLYLLYSDFALLKMGGADIAAEAKVIRNFELFLFELYFNIVEHAREPLLDKEKFQVEVTKANFWFVRIERFSASETIHGSLAPQLPGFEAYRRYLDSKGAINHIVTISFFDNGHGIAGHYAKKTGDTAPLRDKSSFEQLILTRKSSTGRTDAGEGIGRALQSISLLDGYVSIRTNGHWLTRMPDRNELQSFSGETGAAGDFIGTLYTIIIPAFSSP